MHRTLSLLLPREPKSEGKYSAASGCGAEPRTVFPWARHAFSWRLQRSPLDKPSFWCGIAQSAAGLAGPPASTVYRINRVAGSRCRLVCSRKSNAIAAQGRCQCTVLDFPTYTVFRPQNPCCSHPPTRTKCQSATYSHAPWPSD